MAQLKDTLVSGNLRVTDTILADILQADSIKGGIVATGTIWNGNTIDEIYGGTGQNTYTKGDLLYASAANTLSKLSANTGTKQFLSMASSVPSWESIAFADIPALYIGTTKVQSSSVAQALAGITTLSTSGKATLNSLEVTNASTLKGATSLSSTLSVTGLSTLAGGAKLTTTKKIWFGDTYYLELDANGLHTNAGFYSDSFVSAGGLSEGSGTSGIDETAMWEALNAVDSTKKINISHLPYTAGTNISISNTGQISNTYSYTLPLAASGTRGGIQIGFTQTAKKYPVQLDSEKAYVEVPWENTWTALSSSAAGYAPKASGGTTSSSSNTYYFLGYTGTSVGWYSLPANAFNNTTYYTGAASELTTGTDTTGKLWGAKSIADYVTGKINTAISSALYFRGESTTAITNGGTETAKINGSNLNAKTGDLVLYDGKEFAWDGSKWIQLGDESSWAAKTVSITGTGYLTGGGTLESNRTLDISSSKITNNTAATAVTASTNLITANTLYYHKGNSNIVTVGTISSGTWNGNAITAAYGGTGMSGPNPFTGAYRIVYTSSATAMTTLAPNTATTKKFLSMTGTGSAGKAPVWSDIASTDLPAMYIGKTQVKFENTNEQALTGITTGSFSSDVTIGGTLTVSSTSTLNGNVTINSGKSLTLGSGVLTWDNNANAWKLTGNFYATGFVSAGGLSDGSGTGGIDETAMWEALAGEDSTKKINYSHLPISITGGSATTGQYVSAISYSKGTFTVTKTALPSYTSMTADHLSATTPSTTGMLISPSVLKTYVTGLGYTTNTGTVTSITISAGTGITVSATGAITTSGTRTINLDTTYLGNNYVTLATAQTITAKHTFSNGILLNTATSWTSSDRALYFAADGAQDNLRYYYLDDNKGLTYNPNTGALKAGSFVKRGGTSSQFLKADGSVDSSTYLKAHQTIYQLVINNSAGTAQLTYKPATSGTYSITLTKAMVGLGNVTNTAASDYFTAFSSSADTPLSATIGGTTKTISTLYATVAERPTPRSGTNEAGGYDLNTVLAGGGAIRNVSSTSYWAHAPSGIGWFGAAVQINPTVYETGAMQFAYSGNYNGTSPTDKIWWRVRGNDGWADDWHLIYDSSTLTQSVLTGLLGTHYLPTAGGTMTGDITLTNNIAVKGTTTGGDTYNMVTMSTSNNIVVGGTSMSGNVNIYGTLVQLCAGGSSAIAKVSSTGLDVNGDVLLTKTGGTTLTFRGTTLNNQVHTILFQGNESGSNGFKIQTTAAGSYGRQSLGFYTSNVTSGSSPYGPTWKRAFWIPYDNSSDDVTIGNSTDSYNLKVFGHIILPNNNGIRLLDTDGTVHNALYASTSNNLVIGSGFQTIGNTYLYGASILFYTGSTNVATISSTGLSVTGAVTASGLGTFETLKLTHNGGAVKHIEFSRASWNYLAAPTSGAIAFVTNGKAAGASNTDLLVNDQVVSPGSNNYSSLGSSTTRWSAIYGTNGDLAGTLNVTGLSTLIGGAEITSAENKGYRLTGTNYSLSFLLGNGGTNRGIYEYTSAKWLFYFDATDTISNYGNLLPGGNATQALGAVEKRWSAVYANNINAYASSSNATITIGSTNDNYSAGTILFKSNYSIDHNGFKIDTSTAASTNNRGRLALNFWTSANTTDPYTPEWKRSLRISYNGNIIVGNSTSGEEFYPTFYAYGNAQFGTDTNASNVTLKGSLTLGSGVLTWDSAKNAWKLSGNLYATGFISAGGASDGEGMTLTSVSSNIVPDTTVKHTLGTSSKMWLRTYSQYIDTSSGYNLRLCTAGTERIRIAAGGPYVSIGNVSTNSSYSLYTAGGISCASLNNRSDIRLKNIIEDVYLSIDEIAAAPSVHFTWKSDGKDGVGSIAQYWKEVLPWAVIDSENEMAMDYGVISLVSAISIAKTVQDHEARIKELEKENKELKEQLKLINNAL